MSSRSRSRSGSTPEVPTPTDREGRISVLIELRAQSGASPAFALGVANAMEVPGFQLDQRFEPVPMRSGEPGAGLAASSETFLLRGTVGSEDEMDALRQRSEVAEVWRDTPIAPLQQLGQPQVQPVEAMAACPIPPCDCQPGIARGTIADVATYLGVDRIWADGFRGNGIVVGVFDGGITANGRVVKDGETPRRIPRVIDGWPADDWGTEASKWGEHGNMCATDVLGMAPEAHILDLRISGAGGSPGTISRALQALQWCINRHRVDGTPQVVTNSWGIFQETWDTTYARNPNHPYTRKVVEAINEGILVLFAAGNCGDTCPDGRCGPDNGPGKSIWGANGHPMVITVGAVNRNEEFIGYSSRGPAALEQDKPDFCSISHFQGYFPSDSGTSAATPILAGVVALLKQANPDLTQEQVKECLKATAKDIGPAGFDRHSGAGIVQGWAAYDHCREVGISRDRARDELTSVLRDAAASPSLRACLCYHICQTGSRPGCSAAEQETVRRVQAILERYPEFRESFCSQLNCRPEPEIDRCQQHLPYLQRVLEAARQYAGLRSCLCYHICRVGGRPDCSEAESNITRRVHDILQQCPQYREPFCRALNCQPADPCQRYVPYLQKVLTVAGRIRRLRNSLCYYVCRSGSRPDSSRIELAVVRWVLDILRRCPQYREPFCHALGCPTPSAGGLLGVQTMDDELADLARGPGELESFGFDLEPGFGDFGLFDLESGFGAELEFGSLESVDPFGFERELDDLEAELELAELENLGNFDFDPPFPEG